MLSVGVASHTFSYSHTNSSMLRLDPRPSQAQPAVSSHIFPRELLNAVTYIR